MTDDGNVNTRQGEVEEEACNEQVKKKLYFLMDRILAGAEVTLVISVYPLLPSRSSTWRMCLWTKQSTPLSTAWAASPTPLHISGCGPSAWHTHVSIAPTHTTHSLVTSWGWPANCRRVWTGLWLANPRVKEFLIYWDFHVESSDDSEMLKKNSMIP